MNITYTEEKKFTMDQVEKLFLSVGWISGQYPERLYKALQNSSTVITAWDNERLVGLVRSLDDTEMAAYVHYMLVDPEYHRQGIAGNMIEMVKEKYRTYMDNDLIIQLNSGFQTACVDRNFTGLIMSKKQKKRI